MRGKKQYLFVLDNLKKKQQQRKRKKKKSLPCIKLNYVELWTLSYVGFFSPKLQFHLQ